MDTAIIVDCSLHIDDIESFAKASWKSSSYATCTRNIIHDLEVNTVNICAFSYNFSVCFPFVCVYFSLLLFQQ